jgi:EmrB/QacA subfamily drug resistance transporter
MAISNSVKGGVWILAATIIGSSMVFIDGTVVNVALPVLQKEFSASLVDASWVVEAYALMLAALMLVGGSLGDRFGRKKLFALGIVVFALASIACGAAQSVQQLIVSRAMQGIGGALLTPGSLAIITASFDQESRGKAIGTWSGFSAILAGFGPVLGGWLIDHASWRWAFWINVPLAVAALVILFFKVPESRDKESAKHLDWTGATLATFGLGLLVYGLIESSNAGVSTLVCMLTIVGGVVLLVLFTIVESRSKSPMMPLALFKSKTFAGANLLTLFLYAALSGTLFFLPFNLIQVQGYATTEAGAALVPVGWVGCEVWSEKTTHNWTNDRWTWIFTLRCPLDRPKLLGLVLSSSDCAWAGYGDRRRASNNCRDGRRRSAAFGIGLRHQ